MASYFILGLIEIFMLCFNEIKLRGDGPGGGSGQGLKETARVFFPAFQPGRQGHLQWAADLPLMPIGAGGPEVLLCSQLTWGTGGGSSSRHSTQVHSLAAGALSHALAEVDKQGQGKPWVQVQFCPNTNFLPVV